MTPGLRDSYLLTKRALKRLIGKELKIAVQTKCRREYHGSEYGGWDVCSDALGPDSIVYSFGVGDDITFDLSLIDKYSLRIFAFDPTPRSVEWLKSQRLPDRFRWFEVGIAAYDGACRFFPPKNPSFMSFAGKDHAGFLAQSVELPVKRLGTICRELGHDYLDILKMDVEAAEYDVVEDILASGIKIHQVLIEFHHRFSGITLEDTKNAVEKMNHAGYEVFSVSPSGTDYGFINHAIKNAVVYSG